MSKIYPEYTWYTPEKCIELDSLIYQCKEKLENDETAIMS